MELNISRYLSLERFSRSLMCPESLSSTGEVNSSRDNFSDLMMEPKRILHNPTQTLDVCFAKRHFAVLWLRWGTLVCVHRWICANIIFAFPKMNKILVLRQCSAETTALSVFSQMHIEEDFIKHSSPNFFPPPWLSIFSVLTPSLAQLSTLPFRQHRQHL